LTNKALNYLKKAASDRINDRLMKYAPNCSDSTISPFKNRAFTAGTNSQAGQYSDNSLKARSVGQKCKGDWDNGDSEWKGIH
jgi:hypothetical protein